MQCSPMSGHQEVDEAVVHVRKIAAGSNHRGAQGKVFVPIRSLKLDHL